MGHGLEMDNDYFGVRFDRDTGAFFDYAMGHFIADLEQSFGGGDHVIHTADSDSNRECGQILVQFSDRRDVGASCVFGVHSVRCESDGFAEVFWDLQGSL